MLGSVTLGIAEPDRKVLGWVERVELLPMKIKLHAKLDTGADYPYDNIRSEGRRI